MPSTHCVLALALAVAAVVACADPAADAADKQIALSQDDSVFGDCAAGADGDCTAQALQLLQVRGRAVVAEQLSDAAALGEVADTTDAAAAAADRWQTVSACCQSCEGGFCSPESGQCHHSKDRPYYKSCAHIAQEASKGCVHHEERIAEIWESCAAPANRPCGSCGIYSAEFTPGRHAYGGPNCVFVGEKVVPKEAVGGIESVTMTSASSFNSLWDCAAGKSGGSSAEALIVNPWMARTQHQLHIIVKPLNSRGHDLARKLERVTGCRTGQWHDAYWGCHYSKAQLFGSMPGVFSQVVGLASRGALGPLISNPRGQQTLASVGISVLHICGGRPVVLATSNGHGTCSVEHQMT